MTFRQTVLLGFVSLIVLLAGVTAAITLSEGRGRLEKAIEADFERAPDQLRALLSESTREFDVTAKVWANDPQYRSWLGLASSADALGGKVTQETLARSHDGLIALSTLAPATWATLRATNDNGTLLFDLRDRDVYGEDLSQDPLVHRALSGQTTMRLHDNLIEMARPLTDEGMVRGALVAGKPLEPVRLNAEQVLRSKVVVTVSRPPTSGIEHVERGGETWLSTTVALTAPGSAEPIGFATLSRPISAELRPQETGLWRAIAFATVVGIALAVVASLLLARSLTAPVSRLVAATKEIGRGNFEHRVEVHGRGELAQLGLTFNDMAAGLKQRVFFESALRRYLAAPVVDQLVADPSRLRLGGERREVTILFFDVAGFTTLAEELNAVELVALVNAYLDRIVEAIFKNSGTFDKFIGDAVMCFWGAPLDQPDHAAKACQAALQMQAALMQFAATHPSPKVRGLKARIGIHTGVAALGNLGSTQIMSYTAMGDAVNLASRLEGLNKLYGTTTLASEQTVTAAHWPHVREIDRVRVKGRAAPVGVFQVFESAQSVPPAAQQAYADGLAHHRARRFAEAEQAFNAARAAGDGPCAELMAARSRHFIVNPPAPDWDGAYTATEK